MSRGQTRSPHDNFRSFLQKTALTLARGIEGFRGQIQTDCKWEIQVRNKSEESKWTEWFSEFFVKDGEGENQIFRSFYKKRNTSTEKHMSKHCHLSLYFTNMGAILTSSSVMIHQLSPAMIPGTRGKKFRVPLSPWQAHNRSHRPRSLHIRPHCKYWLFSCQWWKWSQLTNDYQKSITVVALLTIIFKFSTGWLAQGREYPQVNWDRELFKCNKNNVFGDIIYNETVIYFETQCSTPRLGTYQTNTSCSSHQQVFVK